MPVFYAGIYAMFTQDQAKMMKKRSTHIPFIREDGPQAERLSGSAEIPL